ncbi:hypothetical protein SISSUDRAFT_1067518 [Sistotremastrum suecicum HHB10207 ss-3]|uniref:Uncharacterized protein n=1 Tax=Sistotremastrum suecicum HHB10207 ss-3 TaxID=1314776 RepID=A0A165X0S1_9AGAM|nr:hypothetical protein SISSUDRAFT_1067518 [Sistotremastrum suecicum HHB10207 ss-3]
MDYVPTPQTGLRRLRMRKDGRYGEDDYTKWPQAYIPAFPHLMCIPRGPNGFPPGLSHLHSRGADLLFLNPRLSWCQDVSSSAVKGLYRLRSSWVLAYEECVETIVRRGLWLIEDYHRHVGLVSGCEYLVQTLRKSVATLADLALPQREIFRLVADVQRLGLELVALDSYMSLYEPRIREIFLHSPLEVNRDLIGVFTEHPQVLQDCFRAGIPVWYIRKDDPIRQNPDWVSLTEVTEGVVIQERHDVDGRLHPYPTIFTGRAEDPEFVVSRYRFSREYLEGSSVFSPTYAQPEPRTIQSTAGGRVKHQARSKPFSWPKG